MSSVDFSWLIGGPQGSGIESGANIFSKVCAEMGYQIFGKREFYSNIKGEHSYFTVRVADKKIHSNVNDVTLMASFDAETIFRHFDEVVSGGGIIYDSDLGETTTDAVHTLDAPFKERLHKELESKNKPFTVSGVLEIAKENGVKLFPVSFKFLLESLSEETENPRLKGLVRMFNVIGVSLSLGLVKMPPDSLQKTIETIFSKKPEIAKINQQTANYSYNYASAKFESFNHTLPGIEKEPRTLLIQGFQGTALGKMACGCRLQPYYPITPASDESVYLESNEILEIIDERPGSTAVIQTEDEICAMGMTIGAALTGTRSATCTSGPGFALMTEMLGWAGMNEVPVVITNYQRSGPSTGLPTRHGQDDLLFSVYAGHGDFPKIVYASGDVEESFYDTGNCFNYADVFQVPVIHMMDKFHASSIITCKRFDPQKIVINRGKLLEKVDDGYRRFEFTDDGVSPRSRLGLDNGIFWNTGDESDEFGHITEDPILRVKMMDKRMSRLDLILKNIPVEEQVVSFGVKEYTIVSWGSTIGPVRDALDLLKKEGISIGLIQLKLLNPFPGDYVSSLFKDVKTIIDVEANYSGQLGKLFKQNTGRDIDYFILKYTGRAMTSTEVYDSLKKIVQNKANKREILMHGA
ncbi:2-oxoacid:ferredoxin oxidoreductase subunit alpha [Nitrosopumilus sp.]|uniref:2-oxoacid:ferredoxin oxidoreductase subunit alpha n=1 Tax=Nitrosopumilus sp. TaxID=2024843 RepID=UPI0034A0758E